MADVQHSVFISSLGIRLEGPARFGHHADAVGGHFLHAGRFDQLRDALERVSSVPDAGHDPVVIVPVEQSALCAEQTLRFDQVPLDVIRGIEDVGGLLVGGLDLVDDFENFHGCTYAGCEAGRYWIHHGLFRCQGKIASTWHIMVEVGRRKADSPQRAPRCNLEAKSRLPDNY